MRSPHGRDLTTHTVTTAGLRRGDVVTVHGTPRTITGMRNIGHAHKLLQFAGGTTHLLNHAETIQVTRLRTPEATP